MLSEFYFCMHLSKIKGLTSTTKPGDCLKRHWKRPPPPETNIRAKFYALSSFSMWMKLRLHLNRPLPACVNPHSTLSFRTGNLVTKNLRCGEEGCKVAALWATKKTFVSLFTVNFFFRNFFFFHSNMIITDDII